MIKCQINNTKEKDAAHSKEKEEVETLEKSAQPNKESQEDNLENCNIKIAELNLELEAKNKLILELLNAHRHEIRQLGKISHKKSIITIFGHKHEIKNFIKNLIFFMKKCLWHLDFGPYLESNFLF